MKLERKWKNKKKKRKKEKEGRKKLLPSGGIREWGRLFLLLYKCIPKVVSDGFTKREEVRLVLGLGFSEIVERDEMRTRGTFSGIREMRQWFEGQNIVAIDEWWQTSHRRGRNRIMEIPEEPEHHWRSGRGSRSDVENNPIYISLLVLKALRITSYIYWQSLFDDWSAVATRTHIMVYQLIILLSNQAYWIMRTKHFNNFI